MFCRRLPRERKLPSFVFHLFSRKEPEEDNTRIYRRLARPALIEMDRGATHVGSRTVGGYVDFKCSAIGVR